MGWSAPLTSTCQATGTHLADKPNGVVQRQRVLPPTMPLLTPYQLGPFELAHRLVYAPLTRCRALGGVPQPAAAEYYRQRSTKGGLMISEATCISDTAQGYPNTPGIYSRDQVAAWKPVVDAVHAEGGVFLLQLWHCGRASLHEYQPGGAAPLSASAIAVDDGSKAATPDGTAMKEYPVPRALETHEVPGIVADYARAAVNAMEAGFDGVEIHGANGYIIDQFLKSNSNKRTDKYGGPIENRARFLIEVFEAVAAAVGDPQRVGLRLSPFGQFLHAEMDPETVDLNLHIIEALTPRRPLYLHYIEPRLSKGTDEASHGEEESLAPFRAAWQGPFMAAGGYNRDNGNAALEAGAADLLAYGRFWLSTPDLPERFAADAPLNHYNRDTFYTPDQKVGYTDYPFREDIPAGRPTRVTHTGAKVFV